MPQQVYYNGFFIEESRVQISPADRGFLFGEGIFETLRSYQGHLLFFEEHSKRLFHGLKTLDLPSPVSAARLKFLAYQVLGLNNLSNAIVRIFVTAQGSEIGDQETRPQKVNLLISAKPFHPFPAHYYEKGVKCVVAKGLPSPEGILSQIKSMNYLTSALAKRQALAQDAFESLLLNSKSEVTEGATSNLFMVKDSRLLTPLSETALKGVTRAQVIGIAQKLKLDFKEASISTTDLQNADEVFLSSSLKELMPVCRIEEKKLLSPCPGILTQQLMESYRDEIQWQTERYLSEKSGLGDLL